MGYEAIVIGVSSGGLNALMKILPFLPENYPCPIVVVQHVSPRSDGYWIESMNRTCNLNVKEADEKEKIERGNIYMAPANYHLLVEKDKTFSLSTEARVNFARPSIDVLFGSAADAYGDGLIGLILTGSNSDGAIGLRKIKEEGGLTIVQDPETAESPSMPLYAISASSVDHILPLDEISGFLKGLV
ncbi:chemotaxis protein CheB [Leptospira hartskeerlii]|uniref:protein-glutamate methylesterase n=1 Tax=Leptospira hartskeerlii TaxID=2023177 RepID=A0A2M9XFH0_9LEPT|nr:chemotaxis protein CheB [Leptospira hartskeerlii]PJZ26426.1 chemotaxis protein CheB [Leptospira hartskeerlii]PJZ34511.1 chemotaxis protein CheB [Leptospira hartskeerlii]